MTVLFRSFLLASALVLAISAAAPAQAQTPVVPAPPATGTTTTGEVVEGAAGGSDTVGCNPAVRAAADAVAQAKTAQMRSRIDDKISQPPSVLQQTCFNQAVGVAASKGGNIFSGDFTSDIQPIVGSALNSFYANFDSAVASFFGGVTSGQSVGDAAGSAIGGLLGGLFGSGASNISGSEYNCDGIERTWEGMSTRGVSPAMQVTFQQLLSGTPPAGASENFLRAWNAARDAGVFRNAQSAVGALPRPVQRSHSPTATTCEVLAAYGIRSGGCNVR